MLKSKFVWNGREDQDMQEWMVGKDQEERRKNGYKEATVCI